MRRIAVSACVLIAAFSALGEELLTAKSIAVLVRPVDPDGWEHQHSELAATVRARVSEEIQKRKRLQIVEDPSQADLVCLYFLYGPAWYDLSTRRKPKPHVLLVSGSSMVIVKGGASPQWHAGPLWMGSTISTDWEESTWYLVDMLHHVLRHPKALKRRPPPPITNKPSSTAAKVFVTCPQTYACEASVRLLKHADAHWNRVDDPARADFVAVWFSTNQEAFGSGAVPGTLVSQTLGAFLIFRGGDRPDWYAMPLLAAFAPTAFELLEPVGEVIAAVHAGDPPAIRRESVAPRRDRKVFDTLADNPVQAALSSPSVELFAPIPGKSVLNIGRDDSDPNVKSFRIYIDGTGSFDIRPLTYHEVTVDPGTHVIAVGSDRNREELLLVTEAGGVYFVMVEATGRVVLTKPFDPSRILSVLSPGAR